MVLVNLHIPLQEHCTVSSAAWSRLSCQSFFDLIAGASDDVEGCAMGLVPPSCLMLRACDEHNWIVQDDTEVFLFACRCDWSGKGARLTSWSLQKFLPVRPKEWRSSNVASQSQSQLNLSSSIEISPCLYVDQVWSHRRGAVCHLHGIRNNIYIRNSMLLPESELQP
jgi:hypothetical protein